MTRGGRLVGFVDRVTDDVIGGWFLDASGPGVAQEVQLEVDGVVLATERCDLERPDLAAAGVAGHGFEFDLPVPLRPGAKAEVRSVLHGVKLAWRAPRVAVARAAAPPFLPGPAERHRSPQQTEAAMTLALHGAEAAAALAGCPSWMPAGGSADAMLCALLSEIATRRA